MFLETFSRMRKHPLGLASFVLILILSFVAVFAPYISPYDPVAINPPERLQPPSTEHVFGTDNAGRDNLSRVLYGTRISLETGIAVVLSAAFFGLSIGLIAGYSRGMIGEILMRLTDAFMGFPYLVLALAIASVLGPSLINCLLAMVVVWWPKYARLTRAEVLILREQGFVEAAKACGASKSRVLFVHILPNSLGPSVIQGSLDFGNVIIVAATLSFIGLGAQPPTPEWGAMISKGSTWLREAWWLTAFPGFAIFVSVLGFNLLGDTLRDAFDPRMR